MKKCGIIDKRITKVVEEQTKEIRGLFENYDSEFSFYNTVAVLSNGIARKIDTVSINNDGVRFWYGEKYLTPNQISSDLTPIIVEIKETLKRIEEE